MGHRRCRYGRHVGVGEDGIDEIHENKKTGMVDGRRHIGFKLESNNQLVVSSDCWTNRSLFGLQTKFVMMRWLRNEGSCLLNDVCIINDDKDGLSSHDSMAEMAGTIRML